jgi:hypothetical protein
MFILAAQSGNFIPNPALLGVILILAVIVGVYWYNTHCPNCNRIFTRDLYKKGKAGRLPTVLSGKERRYYRCKNCGHEWEKDIYTDGS